MTKSEIIAELEKLAVEDANYSRELDRLNLLTPHGIGYNNGFCYAIKKAIELIELEKED